MKCVLVVVEKVPSTIGQNAKNNNAKNAQGEDTKIYVRIVEVKVE